MVVFIPHKIIWKVTAGLVGDLNMVEPGKQYEKENKINNSSKLEEPSLSYILWCEHQWSQMKFENPNFSFKDTTGIISGEDIYNSDLMWRRLIRSVLEQSLAILRSSQGLIVL